MARRSSLIVSGLLIGWIVAGFEIEGVRGGAADPFATGQSWRPLGKAGQTMRPDGSIEVVFDAGQGRVSGDAGCNRFHGPLKVSADRVTVGPLATTRIACAPELMAREAAFLRALSAASAWRLDDDALVLTTGRKTALRLVPAG